MREPTEADAALDEEEFERHAEGDEDDEDGLSVDDEDNGALVPDGAALSKKQKAAAAKKKNEEKQRKGVSIVVRFSLKKNNNGSGYVAAKENLRVISVPADKVVYDPEEKTRHIKVRDAVAIVGARNCSLIGKLTDGRSKAVAQTFNTSDGDELIVVERSDKHLFLAFKEKTMPPPAVAPDDSSDDEDETPAPAPAPTKSKAAVRLEENSKIDQQYKLAERLRQDSQKPEVRESLGLKSPLHSMAAMVLAKKLLAVEEGDGAAIDRMMLTNPYRWTGITWKLLDRPRWPDADAVADVLQDVPDPPPRRAAPAPAPAATAAADTTVVSQLLQQNGAMMRMMQQQQQQTNQILSRLLDQGPGGPPRAHGVTPMAGYGQDPRSYRPDSRNASPRGWDFDDGRQLFDDDVWSADRGRGGFFGSPREPTPGPARPRAAPVTHDGGSGRRPPRSPSQPRPRRRPSLSDYIFDNDDEEEASPRRAFGDRTNGPPPPRARCPRSRRDDARRSSGLGSGSDVERGGDAGRDAAGRAAATRRRTAEGLDDCDDVERDAAPRAYSPLSAEDARRLERAHAMRPEEQELLDAEDAMIDVVSEALLSQFDRDVAESMADYLAGCFDLRKPGARRDLLAKLGSDDFQFPLELYGDVSRRVCALDACSGAVGERLRAAAMGRLSMLAFQPRKVLEGLEADLEAEAPAAAAAPKRAGAKPAARPKKKKKKEPTTAQPS